MRGLKIAIEFVLAAAKGLCPVPKGGVERMPGHRGLPALQEVKHQLNSVLLDMIHRHRGPAFVVSAHPGLLQRNLLAGPC